MCRPDRAFRVRLGIAVRAEATAEIEQKRERAPLLNTFPCSHFPIFSSPPSASLHLLLLTPHPTPSHGCVPNLSQVRLLAHAASVQMITSWAWWSLACLVLYLSARLLLTKVLRKILEANQGKVISGLRLDSCKIKGMSSVTLTPVSWILSGGSLVSVCASGVDVKLGMLESEVDVDDHKGLDVSTMRDMMSRDNPVVSFLIRWKLMSIAARVASLFSVTVLHSTIDITNPGNTTKTTSATSTSLNVPETTLSLTRQQSYTLTISTSSVGSLYSFDSKATVSILPNATLKMIFEPFSSADSKRPPLLPTHVSLHVPSVEAVIPADSLLSLDAPVPSPSPHKADLLELIDREVPLGEVSQLLQFTDIGVSVSAVALTLPSHSTQPLVALNTIELTAGPTPPSSPTSSSSAISLSVSTASISVDPQSSPAMIKDTALQATIKHQRSKDGSSHLSLGLHLSTTPQLYLFPATLSKILPHFPPPTQPGTADSHADANSDLPRPPPHRFMSIPLSSPNRSRTRLMQLDISVAVKNLHLKLNSPDNGSSLTLDVTVARATAQFIRRGSYIIPAIYVESRGYTGHLWSIPSKSKIRFLSLARVSIDIKRTLPPEEQIFNDSSFSSTAGTSVVADVAGVEVDASPYLLNFGSSYAGYVLRRLKTTTQPFPNDWETAHIDSTEIHPLHESFKKMRSSTQDQSQHPLVGFNLSITATEVVVNFPHYNDQSSSSPASNPYSSSAPEQDSIALYVDRRCDPLTPPDFEVVTVPSFTFQLSKTNATPTLEEF